MPTTSRKTVLCQAEPKRKWATFEFQSLTGSAAPEFRTVSLLSPLLLFTKPAPHTLTTKLFPQMKNEGANPFTNQKPHSHTPNAVYHPSSALPPAFAYPSRCFLPTAKGLRATKVGARKGGLPLRAYMALCPSDAGTGSQKCRYCGRRTSRTGLHAVLRYKCGIGFLGSIGRMRNLRRNGSSKMRAFRHAVLALVTVVAIGCVPVFDGDGDGGGGGSVDGNPRTLISQTSPSPLGTISFIASPGAQSTVFATVSGNDPGSRPVISINGLNGSGPFRSSPDTTNSASVAFTPTEQGYILAYSEGGTPGTSYTIVVTQQ